MFLCKKENVERLIKYSIAVPSDENNEDIAYKFPNISHEYICKSPMVLQALIECGLDKQENNSDDDDVESGVLTEEESDEIKNGEV